MGKSHAQAAWAGGRSGSKENPPLCNTRMLRLRDGMQGFDELQTAPTFLDASECPALDVPVCGSPMHARSLRSEDGRPLSVIGGDSKMDGILNDTRTTHRVARHHLLTKGPCLEYQEWARTPCFCVTCELPAANSHTPRAPLRTRMQALLIDGCACFVVDAPDADLRPTRKSVIR